MEAEGACHLRGPLTDELVVVRPGTWWPETSVTLDSGERTVKLDEVFDRSRMPLVPLDKNGEYYSFEFAFHFDNPAKIMVDDGIGFHDLPEDYLPGARIDAATPVHTLAMMDDGAARTNSISLIQREDFFDMPLRTYDATGALKDYTNVIRVTALRKADQGDTKDAGVVTLPTVEPGYGPRYTSSFAITSAANFDPVESYRAGWDYNVPLITALLPADRGPDKNSDRSSRSRRPMSPFSLSSHRPTETRIISHFVCRRLRETRRSLTFTQLSKSALLPKLQ